MIAREKVVIDASVVVKWYVPEAASDRAARVLTSNYEFVAPDLLLSEFGNVLWKKTRRQELPAVDASEILIQFIAAGQITYVSILSLVQSAFEIAVRYNHPIYDSMYLAVAVAQDCRLVTADERLLRAFRDTPFEHLIMSLTAF